MGLIGFLSLPKPVWKEEVGKGWWNDRPGLGPMWSMAFPIGALPKPALDHVNAKSTSSKGLCRGEMQGNRQRVLCALHTRVEIRSI